MAQTQPESNARSEVIRWRGEGKERGGEQERGAEKREEIVKEGREGRMAAGGVKEMNKEKENKKARMLVRSIS